MSLLKHSKTWPITSTMAVVQLRVDQKGRTYSTIATDLQKSQLLNCCHYHHHRNQFHYTTGSMLATKTTATDGQITPALGHIHFTALNRNLTREINSSARKKKMIASNDDATIMNNIYTNNNNNNVVCMNSDENNLRQNCCCVQQNYCNSNNINGSNHNNNNNNNINATSRLERRNRSESIKVDNWDLIFIEKNKQNGGVKSPTDNTKCNENGCISGLGARKVATLRRHYYPEGDWGWIIIVVSVMIGILNHGIQLSAPIFLLPAGKRFQENFVNSAGKSIYI